MPDIEACVGEASKVFVMPGLAKNDAAEAALPWAVTWPKLLTVRSTPPEVSVAVAPMPTKESAPPERVHVGRVRAAAADDGDVLVRPGREVEIRAEHLHAQRRGDGVLGGGRAGDRGGVLPSG